MRILVILFCLVATSVSAQTFELGGRFGVGCVGSEGSLCGEASPLFGVQGSVWTGDSVELSAQFAHLNRDDLAFQRRMSRSTSPSRIGSATWCRCSSCITS